MDIGLIRPDPESKVHANRARKERAQAFRNGFVIAGAALRTVLGGIRDAVWRAWRRRQSFKTLSGLSDLQLKDIGLRRSDIGNVADAVAALPPDVRLTLTDLRRAEATRFEHTAMPLASVAPTERRRLTSRPASGTAAPAPQQCQRQAC